MRTFTKLMVGVASAATITAMAVGPAAMADPPHGTTPKLTDVVGVGSDTTEFIIDQLSHDYNAAHSGTKLYSWDATVPGTEPPVVHDNIVLKKGCKAIPRPFGSSEGVAALTTENQTVKGSPCIDFARSSRDRKPTDPLCATKGVCFVAFAGDALTYATQPGSNAPTRLSAAQLFRIYTCKATTWNQVGGKSHARIAAFIPQSGSGTRAFFLTAIGFSSTQTPGPCVSDVPTKALPGGSLEENEGVNPALNKNKANVIFPFSVGRYLAQRYHSAKCFKTSCTPVGGKICAPRGSQNLFGCALNGTLVLNKMSGCSPLFKCSSPTTVFPLPAKCGKKCPAVNPNFNPVMTRTLFNVVNFNNRAGSQNGISRKLLPFFGPKGWICTNSKAKADMLNYGFIVFKPGSGHGHTLKACGDTH